MVEEIVKNSQVTKKYFFMINVFPNRDEYVILKKIKSIILND